MTTRSLRRPHLLIGLGLVPLIACLAAPASAGVRTDPTVTGSLEMNFRDCGKETEANAIVSTCVYGFAADPAAESDPEDYSVEWVQMSIRPQDGSCLVGARGSLKEPGADLTAFEPGSPVGTGATITKLRVRSSDRVIGTVAKGFTLDSGELRAKENAAGNGLRWHWRGDTSKGSRPIRIAFGGAFADDPGEPTTIKKRTAVKTELGC